MKTLKHLLTALLLMVATVAKAYDFEVDGIYYNIVSEATVSVSGKNSSVAGEVVIPDKVVYNGVTYIIRSIAQNAFSRRTEMTSVIVGDSVKTIAANAFYNCSGLKEVTIGYSVSKIDIYSFTGCTGILKVTFNNKNISHGFSNKTSIKEVVISDNTVTIGDGAFYMCTGLEELVIGNNVVSIGEQAFRYCSGLTKIKIPNSVTEIEGSAFSGCINLESVNIPKNVTSIGEYAFSNCKNLTSIISFITADKLFEPGNNAFNNVDKTNCALYVPYGAKSAYKSTAGWSAFTNIVELEKPITDVTISINQYGSGTYCSEYALDFSDVEGLKAYAATGYNVNTGVVTLTRVQTAREGTGLFVKGDPGEYVVPIMESSDDYSLNMLVGTLETTAVNAVSDDGMYRNYKYTIKDGDSAPLFYQFEDNSSLSANRAYLQIPLSWVSSASKSIAVRFDDGETTDIDEIQGETGEESLIYDMQGRVVENPAKGIYIMDGKKVFIR